MIGFAGCAIPIAFAARWRPLPPDQELVQETDKTPAAGPHQLDSRSKLLFDRVYWQWFWPFAREEPHGHPPFYALLGLAGDVLAPSWQDLPRARLGPILLFSLTAGVIYWFRSFAVGRLAGGSCGGRLGLAAESLRPRALRGLRRHPDVALDPVDHRIRPAPSPRPIRVPHAKWTDGPGACCSGSVLGCAAATKFTGWFLPLPFLVWSCFYRSRRGFTALLVGGLIAIAVLFALLPPWWHDPVNGVHSVSEVQPEPRATRPIQIQFLGTVYNTPESRFPGTTRSSGRCSSPRSDS